MSRGRAPSHHIDLALMDLLRARSEWRDLRESEYAAAVDATRGVMLNAAARARGVTSWDLYTHNRAYVARWGSPELVEHLAAHPRTTWAAWERALRLHRFDKAA